MPHTPGPWRIGQSRVSDDTDPFDTVEQLAIYNMADGVKVARIETWIGKQERAESEANARLIAAAPELLEALKDAQLWIHTLLCATPDEATDYITNNGEQVEADCRHAIAKAEGR